MSLAGRPDPIEGDAEIRFFCNIPLLLAFPLNKGDQGGFVLGSTGSPNESDGDFVLFFSSRGGGDAEHRGGLFV